MAQKKDERKKDLTADDLFDQLAKIGNELSDLTSTFQSLISGNYLRSNSNDFPVEEITCSIEEIDFDLYQLIKVKTARKEAFVIENFLEESSERLAIANGRGRYFKIIFNRERKGGK